MLNHQSAMSEPQMSQTSSPNFSNSGSAGAAQSATVSTTVNEEDIDPFTYRPPLTKWDYLKVRNITTTVLYTTT